jgi:hypothetical protein
MGAKLYLIPALRLAILESISLAAFLTSDLTFEISNLFSRIWASTGTPARRQI